MRSWSSPVLPAPSNQSVPLRLFDTADGQLRPLASGAIATMYVCGITPYDTTHLGHAATYLTFDLVYRQLRDSGIDVHYVQNVTDVDDPLFERAKRDGVDWRDLGDGEVAQFRADMEYMSVIPPRDYIGAIESIPQVVHAVQRLLDKGIAYQLDADQYGYADIYFPTNATLQFGYESGLDEHTMAQLFAERGGDPQREGKRHPLDALLWRAARDGEPSWPAPFGSGRPGWHIECSVIAQEKLGPVIDIQGGGSDLIFPHHEFSAAHTEALCDTRRFARFYVHAAMIGLDGEKMSKSLGNIVRVRELAAQGVSANAIRLALFSGHYRSDRMWDDSVLKAAQQREKLWSAACTSPADDTDAPAIVEFRRALADDLDTVSALSIVDSWAKNKSGHNAGSQPTEFIAVLDALLGIKLSA